MEKEKKIKIRDAYYLIRFSIFYGLAVFIFLKIDDSVFDNMILLTLISLLIMGLVLLSIKMTQTVIIDSKKLIKSYLFGLYKSTKEIADINRFDIKNVDLGFHSYYNYFLWFNDTEHYSKFKLLKIYSKKSRFPLVVDSRLMKKREFSTILNEVKKYTKKNKKVPNKI